MKKINSIPAKNQDKIPLLFHSAYCMLRSHTIQYSLSNHHPPFTAFHLNTEIIPLLYGPPLQNGHKVSFEFIQSMAWVLSVTVLTRDSVGLPADPDL